MATRVSIGKLVPSAIVLAVAGACTWPFLGEPESAGLGREVKVPQIAQALLSPAIGEAPGRDPFKSPGELQPNVLATYRYKNKDSHGSGGKPSTAGAGAEYVPNDRIAQVIKMLGDPFTLKRATPRGEAPSALKLASKVNMAELLAKLALNATWIQGPSRVAVINGRIYRQGDALEAPASVPVVVAQVFPDRVRLECRGVRAELTFSEPAGKPSAPAAAPPAPRHVATPPRRAETRRKLTQAR